MPQVVIIPRAEAAEIQPKVWSVDEIKAEAVLQAHLHGLNEKHFVHVMELESSGWLNGQSTVPDKTGPNGQEDSWGVCQIHLPDHSEVTKEQALDPHFCLSWSAEQWAVGNASLWTEWRLNYGI